MDVLELRARLHVLIAERQAIAAAFLAGHRAPTNPEIARIASLTGSIAGLAQILNDVSPPAPTNPPAPGGGFTFGSPEADRIAAEASLTTVREGFRIATEAAGEYGRWLVATIAAANLGGLYLVGTAPAMVIADDGRLKALWLLVIGLMLILFSGLATWRNYGAAAAQYERWSNPAAMAGTNPAARAAAELAIRRTLNVTYTVSLVLGVASALCIPVAAIFALGAH